MPHVHSLSGAYRNPSNPATPQTIPDGLTRRDQWVCWKYGNPRSDGKREKIPINPATGRRAKTSEPSTWGTYQQALAAAQEHGYDGVGFVLTPEDPFFFVDIDNVRDPETGKIKPWAMQLVESFGSYTEVSPSGTGLRIAVLGRMPFKKAGTPPVELFSQGGYVTITGNTLIGYNRPIVEAQDALEDLYREFCQPEPVEDGNTTAAPLPDPIDLTDRELLDKARAADKLGWKFTALFDAGDLSHSNNDASRADNDLMMQLAFWTGKDPNRMERLFSESALGQRDKWKTRHPYRRDTIAHAIKKTRAVYEPEQHRPNKTKTRDSIREMFAHAILLHAWAEKTGRADAGATDFFGYLGLLRLAHKANTLEIDVSIRDYMEAAGIADFTTALNSLARITDTHRLVEKVRDGGSGNAARYRLKAGSKPKHIQIRGNSSTPNQPCGYNECAGLLIPLAGAYLIRNPSPEMPEFDKNGRKIPKAEAPMVKSVGKAAAMVAYVVAATAPIFGGVVPPEFVSQRTGVTVKNLKARHVPKLVAAGLVDAVEVEGNPGYAVPEDVNTALKEELRVSGSLAAAKHQRDRHDRQRRAQEIRRLAWLGHDAEAIAAETGFDPDEIAAVVTPPDEAPTREEMDAARLAKGADGTLSELVKESPTWVGEFPDPDDAEQPLGHDYPEAPQTPVGCSEGTPPAPPDDTEAVQGPTEVREDEPCIHSGLGYVFPGGRGCYCCDKNHPMRQHERENGVVDLEAYRRSREVA